MDTPARDVHPEACPGVVVARTGGVLAAVWVGLVMVGVSVGLILVGTDGTGPVVGTDRAVHDWVIAHRAGLVGLARVLAFWFDAPVMGVWVSVGTVVAVVVGWRRGTFRWSTLGPAVAYLGAEGTVFAVRLVIHRPRPRTAAFPATDALVGIHETSWSFPSGHGTGPIAVLLALAGLVVLRRGGWWPYLAAVVVGLGVAASRVVLGVHWFTDVTVGAALGAVWGVAVCWAQRRVEPAAVPTRCGV